MISRLITLLILLPATALAAGLKVSPPRLTLEPGQMNTEVRLSNAGDGAVSVQASLHRWQLGPDGRERESESADLAIYPKVFVVQPGASQTVRVGRLPSAPLHPDTEIGYRLTLRELPLDLEANTIGVARRLRLPLWLAPVSEHSDWALTGVSHEMNTVMRKSLEDDEAVETEQTLLSAQVSNRGNVHLRLVDINFIALAADGSEHARATAPGWYVLGGGTRSFSTPMPEGFCQGATALRVRLRLATSAQDSDWPLTAVCGRS